MKIKQVVLTGKNQVELQDLELDEKKIAPTEILIETERSFISAGTELSYYTGLEPKVFIPGSWCAYPFKSGYANVGTVRAVGSAVTRFKVGQRVFSLGKHASFQLYDVSRLVLDLPEGLNPNLAAAARMAGVAYTAIDVAEPGRMDWVAIFGLGMVGQLAAQMFQIMGRRVIGIDLSEKRRRLASQVGIRHVIGGTSEEVFHAIRDLTRGEFVNTGVDAVGHTNVVLDCMKITAKNGEVILLGSPRAEVNGNITSFLSDAHLRCITIRGALEWRLPIYPPEVGKAHSQLTKMQTIFNWIVQGQLKLDSSISHVMKPAEIKKAYDGLLNQKDEYTGVVLDWTK